MRGSRAAMNHVIEVSNLSVTFDDFEAVRDVSFSVEKGQILVIIGLSGSGKSTILRSLLRLNKFTGDVYVNCKHINELNKKELIYYRAHDISMIFQNFALLPHFNVIDNIILGLSIRKYSKKEAYQIAQPYVEMVGLNDWKFHRISQLSGGMKQRVGLCRALTNKSPILLLDEALSSLDPITRYELQYELIRIRDMLGITMIAVTHDMVEASTLADKVIMLNKGQIVQEGTFKEIWNSPNCEHVDKFIRSSRISQRAPVEE